MEARWMSTGPHQLTTTADRKGATGMQSTAHLPPDERADEARVRLEAAAALAGHIADGDEHTGELVDQVDVLVHQAQERLHLRSLRLVS
jgi:hypothetical protein